MRGTRAVGVGLVCLITAIAGAACSSGGSSNGDKTAFCKTNADITARLSKVSSADEAVQAFKDVQGQFDSYVKNAPKEVKADAQLQVDAARKAISDNNASQFETDQKLKDASDHVDTFCGQKSSSASSSSSSSSSRSSSSSSGSGNAQAACSLFNLDSLNSATNLTWKVVEGSQSNACVVQAGNGNTVSMNVTDTQGHGTEALTAGKSACDSGTAEDASIADGGFTCKVAGINTAVAVYNGSGKLVAVSAITFNGASDSDVANALIALLKSFQAS